MSANLQAEDGCIYGNPKRKQVHWGLPTESLRRSTNLVKVKVLFFRTEFGKPCQITIISTTAQQLLVPVEATPKET